MFNHIRKHVKSLFAVVIFLLTAIGFFAFFTPEKKVDATLSAYSSEAFTVHRYEVNATVTAQREIIVEEEMQVTINRVGSQKVFYKSLPLEGDRYRNLWAEGVGNPNFSYKVANNPDVDGFIDINCKGGVEVGATLTYRFGYTLLIAGEDFADGMIVDFVGAGCPVAYRNVTLTIHFPAPLVGDPTIYSAPYGVAENRNVTVAQRTDRMLVLTATELPVGYNPTFGEYCANPITVSFTLEAGGFVPYASTLFSSPALGWMIGVSLLPLALAIVGLIFVKKRRTITSIVNIKAPEKMDPLLMGILLDGTADSEDFTAMVYYFADKGYINISFEDVNNPKLIKVKEIEDDAPAYQKVLFNGLFGKAVSTDVESLKYEYYKHIERARVLTSAKKNNRYEKKTVGWALFVVIASILTAVALPFFLGKMLINPTYAYFPMTEIATTAVFSLFILAFLFLAEEKRFKGGSPFRVYMEVMGRQTEKQLKSKIDQRKLLIGLAVVLVIVGVLVGTLIPSHVFTWVEKLIMYFLLYLAVCLGATTISRTQSYCDTLGQIVGFKEFILVAEADRIKFMLEEDPQAYYHILPYAQVLGVTDAWESKFKGLTIEPPAWCVGYDMTVFDYLILSRAMRVMRSTMIARPESNGSGVGRSGGGGGFGGFSGGGHGGGGFGTR